MWEIEIWHNELGKYKKIRGYDKSIVEWRAESQKAEWDETWEKIQQRKINMDNKSLADEMTQEAKKALIDIENVLISSLEFNHKINWDDLKNHSFFSRPIPEKKTFPPLI